MKKFPCEIVLLLMIVAVSIFVRLRLAGMPLERDEGEYAYAGQLMLQGIPPYKLAYNMKLPGTYAAYAAVMAIFGQSDKGIHYGLTLVSVVTILLVYLLWRPIAGAAVGFLAAAAFALLSLSYPVFGLAAHATHFVTVFAVGGAVLLWHGIKKDHAYLIATSGCLFGLSFLMKQPGFFFGVFGIVIIVHRYSLGTHRHWRKCGGNLAIFGLAFMLPVGLTCGLLQAAHVFPRFWFWCFSYSRAYGSLTSLGPGWHHFLHAIKGIFFSAPLLCLSAGAGLVIALSRANMRNIGIFPFAFLVCSFAAVCPGLYFREHYFIPLLPSVALFAAIGIRQAPTLVGVGRPLLVSLCPVVLFLVVAADMISRQANLFFRLKPDDAARAIYGENPFPEAREVAYYIQGHSNPDSRIAVLGSEPEIYFYSKRHSATGYIYTYPLTEPQKYALTMQQEMIAEIEKNKPEFIVFVNVSKSWLATKSSEPLIFNWFEQYGPQHYSNAGSIEVPENGEGVYQPSNSASTSSTRRDAVVRVFKREDAN